MPVSTKISRISRGNNVYGGGLDSRVDRVSDLSSRRKSRTALRRVERIDRFFALVVRVDDLFYYRSHF